MRWSKVQVAQIPVLRNAVASSETGSLEGFARPGGTIRTSLWHAKRASPEDPDTVDNVDSIGQS